MDIRYSGTVSRERSDTPGSEITRSSIRRHFGSGRRLYKNEQNGNSHNGSGRTGTVKLLVCFGIIAVTLSVKLIFPGVSVKMKQEILPVLEYSVNYKEAFTSVGKFFSGEKGFQEAFNDMVAFLVRGEEAVRVGAESEKNADPLPGNSIMAMESLLDPGLHLNAGLFPAPEYEAAVTAWDEGNVAEQADTAEPIPEGKSDAEVFVEAQGLFYGYDIPEDVEIEKTELPFEYIKPVEGVVSSGFGYRTHPVDNEVKFHYGLDYDAPEGTDILSFADGTVLVSGESKNLGYYLIIAHGDGFVTQYFHCKKLTVLSGDKVAKGQKIAEVGQTGNATGPCLHFEIIHNGAYLNPEYYLKKEG